MYGEYSILRLVLNFTNIQLWQLCLILQRYWNFKIFYDKRLNIFVSHISDVKIYLLEAENYHER